jgi:2-amino-4-hydroxy-6-hydroxymethyldihydropteridine diphosphokinase
LRKPAANLRRQKRNCPIRIAGQETATLAVLGLGSNLGDSHTIVIKAVEALKEMLSGLRSAPLYETEPLYVTDQGRFINTAVAGWYNGLPDKLLLDVQKIEQYFGRDRLKERRWGERILDIDILVFGNLLIKERDLEIPHPRIKERRFALEPLLDLLPKVTEPGTGLSYRSICESLPDQGIRRIN